MLCRRTRFLALAAIVALLAVSPAFAQRVLFDARHGQTAGNADWIVDADSSLQVWSDFRCQKTGNHHSPQRFPTPPQSEIGPDTTETFWDGGISAWAVGQVLRPGGVAEGHLRRVPGVLLDRPVAVALGDESVLGQGGSERCPTPATTATSSWSCSSTWGRKGESEIFREHQQLSPQAAARSLRREQQGVELPQSPDIGDSLTTSGGWLSCDDGSSWRSALRRRPRLAAPAPADASGAAPALERRDS